MSDWNPRYLHYARSQGATSAEEQMAKDRERWPGGPMTGFSGWINEQWRAWGAERGIRRDDPLSEADHVDFDAWLAERNPVEAVG